MNIVAQKRGQVKKWMLKLALHVDPNQVFIVQRGLSEEQIVLQHLKMLPPAEEGGQSLASGKGNNVVIQAKLSQYAWASYALHTLYHGPSWARMSQASST